MDTRRILSSTALYGLADVAVMAVGGFLLLPLYTRTLTQAEFGHFVAIRANIDIFTYLLHLGLPSAVARIYFDHRKLDQQREFLSSIVCFFLVALLVFVAVLGLWGSDLWHLLSPGTPAQPYLPFSVTIAALGFLSAISVMWLRVEQKAVPVVGLQVGASVVLAVTAGVTLVGFDMHLPGVLLALLLSTVVPALALPFLFGSGFRLAIRKSHITEALRYAGPVLVGYIAYFVLNRISTVLLQRHVSAEELAVFGLAQQLSMIVGIACTSFGAALQPAVFSADAAHVNDMLRKAGRILTLMMTTVTCLLMLFANELTALVAPKNYHTSEGLLMVLIIANFTGAFTLMSDTALMYHRRPKTSMAVSIFGALVAAGLGLWLIPLYHAQGAGASIAGAFVARMLLSHWMARRITGQAHFGAMSIAMATVCAMALAASALQAAPLAFGAALGTKIAFGLLILSATYLAFRKS
jgi:O-antigen/teichoic acid export membrane protein